MVEVIKLFIIIMAPTTKIFRQKLDDFFNHLLLCFCKPVIGPWALRENNALQFSHNWPIRACVILATNTSHIIITVILPASTGCPNKGCSVK